MRTLLPSELRRKIILTGIWRLLPYVVWAITGAATGWAPLKPAQAETPCKHRWVEQLAPQLEKLAPQIPMSLMLGWIQVESGGNLSSTTSLDERGYFQLMPDESKQLKLDHQRLSTDSAYSLQGGVLLVELYAETVENLGYSRSDPDFWRMVKFEHAIGSGAVAQLLKDMQAHQVTSRSWMTIEQYSKDNKARLFQVLRHDPVKWTANVDEVFAQGSQLEKEWHENCTSGRSTEATAEGSAQVLADVWALYTKRVTKLACGPPIMDYPRWSGYPVQLCEYSDVGVVVHTYMLNASTEQLAGWTVTACQDAKAPALSVCVNAIATIILRDSSGVFPIAGYIPEPASVLGTDRPGGLCFLFRDGVTIDTRTWKARPPENGACGSADELTNAATRAWTYARVASTTRDEYRLAGGELLVGTDKDGNTAWLDVVREAYKHAWTSQRNDLISAKAKSWVRKSASY